MNNLTSNRVRGTTWAFAARTLILSCWLGFIQHVRARGVRIPSVDQLFEDAPLAVTAEVTSVKPLLPLETKLSYYDDDITFYWLSVGCEVGTVLKGELSSNSIEVAMLAVKDEDQMKLKVDPPLMLSPTPGEKYVMFLAPSSSKGVYASMLAPYDEANAIFILDRKAAQYDSSRLVASEGYMKQWLRKKDLVFSLVNEGGQLSKAGAEEVKKRYVIEIRTRPRKALIPLEWKTVTDAQGWTVDVPKHTPKVSTD